MASRVHILYQPRWEKGRIFFVLNFIKHVKTKKCGKKTIFCVEEGFMPNLPETRQQFVGTPTRLNPTGSHFYTASVVRK